MAKCTNVLVFLFVFTSLLYAQENSLITKLKKKYNLKSVVQLTFDLEIFWKVREKKEKKHGELILAPNDKFFCKIGSNQWISNGTTYWQYNKKTSQVIVKKLQDIDLSVHPSKMIESYLNYPYTINSTTSKVTVLEWSPSEKKRSKNYQKITLFIDNYRTTIKKIQVIDKNGNESTYTFKKTKLNVQVPLTVFSFEIPKGVDVFDDRD